MNNEVQQQTAITRSVGKRRWIGVLLNLHFFASVFVAVMVAFYALSGFFAMHPHWFGVGAYDDQDYTEQIERVPSSVAIDEAALAAYCAELLHKQATASLQRKEGDEWWFVAEHADRILRCRIDTVSRSVDSVLQHRLDASAPTAAQPLSIHLEELLGGHLDEESFFHDAQAQTLSFNLESVWFEKHVNVFMADKVFQVNHKAEPIIGGIINLHKGEHASGFQTFLADLTAFALLFVVFSGLLIGLQMKKRKRMTVLASVVSCVLLVLFVIAR